MTRSWSGSWSWSFMSMTFNWRWSRSIMSFSMPWFFLIILLKIENSNTSSCPKLSYFILKKKKYLSILTGTNLFRTYNVPNWWSLCHWIDRWEEEPDRNFFRIRKRQIRLDLMFTKKGDETISGWRKKNLTEINDLYLHEILWWMLVFPWWHRPDYEPKMKFENKIKVFDLLLVRHWKQ
jgi:hypothetical protein